MMAPDETPQIETDAERLERAPGRAFEWVMREVELPDETTRTALREAFLSVANEGHGKAVRTLERVWPESARWPSGEAYLRSIGWLPPSERIGDQECDDEEVDAYEYDGYELMDLLFHRLLQVAHRMYCDEQVRRALDPVSPPRIKSYTHAILNRGCDWWEDDPCGLGVDKIVSIEEGLRQLEQPAHEHPRCQCTVNPYPTGGGA